MELDITPMDYETIVYNLIIDLPSIYSVVIVEGDYDIAYSTDNWEISTDIPNICSIWESMNAPFLMMFGLKFTILECEIDSIVATSLLGKGHIVGVKDEERKIIAYVAPHGDKKAAIVELSRILSTLNSKEPYMDKNTQFSTEDIITSNKEEDCVNPLLKNDILTFLNWIKNPDGLQGYINYALQQNNVQTISELAKIYSELIDIFDS
ncbi:MAG: hypothetical protein ACFFC3_06480 [Candidatus Odinarchaeota archaeon]